MTDIKIGDLRLRSCDDCLSLNDKNKKSLEIIVGDDDTYSVIAFLKSYNEGWRFVGDKFLTVDKDTLYDLLVKGQKSITR